MRQHYIRIALQRLPVQRFGKSGIPQPLLAQSDACMDGGVGKNNVVGNIPVAFVPLMGIQTEYFLKRLERFWIDQVRFRL